MIYNPEIAVLSPSIQFKYPAWWTEQMSTLVDQKEQLHKNKLCRKYKRLTWNTVLLKRLERPFVGDSTRVCWRRTWFSDSMLPSFSSILWTTTNGRFACVVELITVWLSLIKKGMIFFPQKLISQWHHWHVTCVSFTNATVSVTLLILGKRTWDLKQWYWIALILHYFNHKECWVW